MQPQDLFASEILIVSGKGGTGKSTVAAAIATAAAATGRPVLLAEVEGRGEVTRTLSVPDPGFQERPTAAGFNVLSITPQAAALEYLHLFVGMDRVSRSLLRTGVLDQIIGGAPGFRDVLACGKLYEITRVRRTDRRDRGRPLYDLVIVDAPPTGQIAAFLAAPAAFAELIKVGRIQRQVAAIRELLRGGARVALVTTLEEMAVTETLEAIPAIAATGVRVGALMANRMAQEVFAKGTRRAAGRLDPEVTSREAGGAGLDLNSDIAGLLLDAAVARDARFRLQEGFLTDLRGTGLPVTVLPQVPGAEPPVVVRTLATTLAGRGTDSPPPAAEPPSLQAARPRKPAPDVPSASRLDPGLLSPRIVVVCGSGGVGKTTISAAIALRLAEGGRKTILLTVDPARRLATALGLPILAGERTTLRLSRGRTMEALQLDTQRTFDELITRYAGAADRRDRILGNPFYRRISDTLSGTSEYMAMEKLYELADEEGHEAIVIDTPPTRSALSFLDAPNRLTDFLGGRLLRWMVWPSARAGRLTLGVARVGATTFARAAGRLVGVQALADTADFLAAFEGMYGGFKERALRVLELLRSSDCVFLVATAPRGPGLEEAGYFVDRLRQKGMQPAAVVANRWHREAALDASDARAAVEALAGGSPQQRAVGAVLEDRIRREADRAAEDAAMARFAHASPGIPIASVPELPGGVHDLSGLRRVARELFDETVEERASGKPSAKRSRLPSRTASEHARGPRGWADK